MIVLFIYLIMFMPMWIVFTREMVKYETQYGRIRDNEDKIVLILLGFISALFWPLFIPGLFVWKKVFSE